MGVSAEVKTNVGSFTITFFDKESPRTVSNFVNLAKDGFYNGTVFHRVIEGFMIQGGDPKGTGTGGPGYRFKDEFHPSLKHDRKGLLSMANAGPNTNGSQFFVTVAPTPHLNNRHAIFGEVTKGYDVVDKISKCDTDHSDRPVNEVKIESVTVTGDFTPVDIGKI